MQRTRDLLKFINRGAAALAAACVFLFAPAVMAQYTALESYGAARAKVSQDLTAALSVNSITGTKWAKETSAGRMVKVLVMARPTVDPDLVNLRSAVVSAGGSVYYRYISVSGLAVVLPAAKVIDLARRSDVRGR
jgi:hypothetical protein